MTEPAGMPCLLICRALLILIDADLEVGNLAGAVDSHDIERDIGHPNPLMPAMLHWDGCGINHLDVDRLFSSSTPLAWAITRDNGLGIDDLAGVFEVDDAGAAEEHITGLLSVG